MKTLSRLMSSCPLLVAMAALACSPSASSKVDEGPEPVFSEHKFLNAEQPTKEIGEACDTYGASECTSGLCVHATDPAPDRGHICTVRCNATGDCPNSWHCGQVVPSLVVRFCIPSGE